MNERYDSIPATQKQLYLENAEQAFDEAAIPVWRALGSVVVGQAEDIVAGQETPGGPVLEAESIAIDSALSSVLVDEVSEYVVENDLQRHLLDEMEAASSDIGRDAEIYANSARDESKSGYFKPIARAIPNQSRLHRKAESVNHLYPNEQEALAEELDEKPEEALWLGPDDEGEYRW